MTTLGRWNTNYSYLSSPTAGRFRYVLHLIFRLWLFLLNCWASKYVLEIKPNLWDRLSDPELIRKHKYYQSELSRVFTPHYHFCSSICGGCCSDEDTPRRYAVDYFLLGGKEGNVHRRRFDLVQMWKGFLIFTRHTKLLYTPTKEDIFTADTCRTSCPELIDSGCRLPGGCRYVICVIHLCHHFCRQMTWQEYTSYLKICSKYMIHVTISIYKIIYKFKRLNKNKTIIAFAPKMMA